ncbi:MAG: alpha/beta hydrolase [Deltaproteobacteria bacterium]|nr:alpha/beta hydrolase [Deltaproteobacteria bacterium]
MGTRFHLGWISWLAASLCGAACGQQAQEPACQRAGCEGALLCEVPEDPGSRGPWPVGARTVSLAGLTAEFWYPARFGSQDDAAQVVYDVRTQLPAEERAKIPDSDNPYQTCDCYRDLPIDEARGPYPLVVFFHGTAAFRSQSLDLCTHLASRGFVVLAADHPGLRLADALGLAGIESDLPGDAAAMLAALAAPEGECAFLEGELALDRVGLIGHSAGGRAAGQATGLPGVRASVPMAYEGAEPGPLLEALLVLGAQDDAVVPYERQQAGYEASPAPKHLVGIANAGHLAFSDLCAMTNADGQDLVEIAVEHGVTNAELALLLWDGCGEGQTSPEQGWAIVDYASAAIFEQALTCRAGPDPLAEIEDRFSLVAEHRCDP